MYYLFLTSRENFRQYLITKLLLLLLTYDLVPYDLVTFLTWVQIASVQMAMLLISSVAGATIAVFMSNFEIIESTVMPKGTLGLTAWALLGFIVGVMIWYALSFLRIRIIRLLLSYDHWFIGRMNFVDYVSDL